MRRGRYGGGFFEAIHKIAQHTQVDLGIHLIFGNPAETDEHIVENGGDRKYSSHHQCETS